MSTHTQSARRRASAVVGALALGIAGLAGASSAFADQGNIDPNATGSIVIHKHEAGSQKADVPSLPLTGGASADSFLLWGGGLLALAAVGALVRRRIRRGRGETPPRR